MKAVVVAKILQICNDLVDNVDNNPYNNLDNNPSKVVVVVAGQDVLPHYTTLCLFCLKVLEEEEKLKESALVLFSSFSDQLIKLCN